MMTRLEYCSRCIHMQKKLYMELENGDKLYNYWCKFNPTMKNLKCNRFKQNQNAE